MKVTEKDVRYVADLANLELTAEEQTRMLRDLNSILEYIDTLNELDTAGVPPMAQVIGTGEQSQQFEYAMRADEVRPSLGREQTLANAPETDGTYFKVPKVLDRQE